jgi:hypothetical protein
MVHMIVSPLRIRDADEMVFIDRETIEVSHASEKSAHRLLWVHFFARQVNIDFCCVIMIVGRWLLRECYSLL